MDVNARRLLTGAAAVLLLLGACTAAPAPSSAPPSATAPPTSAGASSHTARPIGTTAGAPLGYIEYLPPGYEDGQPRPLLVFLHGAGESGDGTEAQLDRVYKLGIPPLIKAGNWPDDRPFVVLMPQYSQARAEGECDLAEDVQAFLDFAAEHYEIDGSRLYLTGISCGAIGVWDYLAGDSAATVAAAVPIAGHAEGAFEEAGCELGRVPVWAFHGALDETVPAIHIEGPIDRIRACDDPAPAEMKLTVYPDADHFENDAWTRTYDLSAGHDVYAWLLSHERR